MSQHPKDANEAVNWAENECLQTLRQEIGMANAWVACEVITLPFCPFNYRRKPEPQKPLEFWLNTYTNGARILYDTKEQCSTDSICADRVGVHLREVRPTQQLTDYQCHQIWQVKHHDDNSPGVPAIVRGIISEARKLGAL